MKRRSESITPEYRAKIVNLLKMKGVDRKELVKQVEEETGEKIKTSDLGNWLRKERELGNFFSTSVL